MGIRVFDEFIAHGFSHSSALASTAHFIRMWVKLEEPMVWLWDRESYIWRIKEERSSPQDTGRMWRSYLQMILMQTLPASSCSTEVFEPHQGESSHPERRQWPCLQTSHPVIMGTVQPMIRFTPNILSMSYSLPSTPICFFHSSHLRKYQRFMPWKSLSSYIPTDIFLPTILKAVG